MNLKFKKLIKNCATWSVFNFWIGIPRRSSGLKLLVTFNFSKLSLRTLIAPNASSRCFSEKATCWNESHYKVSQKFDPLVTFLSISIFHSSKLFLIESSRTLLYEEFIMGDIGYFWMWPSNKLFEGVVEWLCIWWSLLCWFISDILESKFIL